MAVYKLTGSSVKNGRTEYSSFLAGNPAVTPPSYESIATASGNGSSATITFSSIPSTYTHLQIRAITRDTSALNDSYGAKLKINSDTGSNYTSHYLLGTGSGISSGSQGTSITPPKPSVGPATVLPPINFGDRNLLRFQMLQPR